jgi:hypothetical protein
VEGRRKDKKTKKAWSSHTSKECKLYVKNCLLFDYIFSDQSL